MDEDKSAKDHLLERVVDHFVADGLGDLSLRKIAGAIGTSHRMLLYHFGSKDGLLLEVVRAVEARSRSQLEEIGHGASFETDVVLREMWRFVADPAQADFERLFFALYGRALQGDEEARPLLAESIASWLEANDTLAARPGPRPRPARSGGGARFVARSAGHRGPGRCRCLARDLRPPLRGLVVGGGAPSGRSRRRPRRRGRPGKNRERTRLVTPPVAGNDHKAHRGPRIDPSGAVPNGRGVKLELGTRRVGDRPPASTGIEGGHPPEPQ